MVICNVGVNGPVEEKDWMKVTKNKQTKALWDFHENTLLLYHILQIHQPFILVPIIMTSSFLHPRVAIISPLVGAFQDCILKLPRLHIVQINLLKYREFYI